MSTRLSPFSSAEPEVEKLRLSADRRFSAISKLLRVRVEASKKRLMHGLAAQRRHLLDRPRRHLGEGLGGVEHQLDLPARELGDAEQVLALPAQVSRRRSLEPALQPLAG